jgi:hypothetical protein
MMRKLLIIVLLLTGVPPHAAAQEMVVSGSKLVLPKGGVIGAAFYEQRGLFYVQQAVASTDNGDLETRLRPQLSSWGIKSRSMLAKRQFDLLPAGYHYYPCGRVEASAKSNQILTCSAETHIEILEPDNLNTVGKIAYNVNQYILDFALDDARSRVVVLSSRDDASMRLTAYSMPGGAQQQETVIPSTSAGSAGVRLALDSATGQVAVAVNRQARFSPKADIYICGAESTFGCKPLAKMDWASQMSFLGRQLLVAVNIFADRKKDCVVTIDPTTRSVSHDYCSPATGVHYAVGVVEKMYVVGFTGVSKRNWLSEEDSSASTSFSVWRAENSRVAAVTKDPTDYGSFQNTISIVASNLEPLFITYSKTSNVFYLYSIIDPDRAQRRSR